MTNDLSVVSATGSGCVIERETSGVYIVSHRDRPRQRLRVATLPCAWATCRDLERQGPAAPGAEGGWPPSACG
jgi:hypothetical protein